MHGLAEAVRERTAHALAVGALRPIDSEQCILRDGAVRFIVRIAHGLSGKRAAGSYQEREPGSATKPPADPFLPYDRDLYVADVSDTHVALLNKFNVIEHHLLIVTREFVDQQAALTVSDFAALNVCMTEYDSLAFYNSGKIAGASQRHRHLQLVPLPLLPGEATCPIEPLLSRAHLDTRPGVVAGLRFRHLAALLPAGATSQSTAAPQYLHDTYLRLLGGAGLDPRAPAPYNLLVARCWMLLVPRRREHFCTISVNALGFAGSLFVTGAAQLEVLRDRGPMAVLASVAGHDD